MSACSRLRLRDGPDGAAPSAHAGDEFLQPGETSVKPSSALPRTRARSGTGWIRIREALGPRS